MMIWAVVGLIACVFGGIVSWVNARVSRQLVPVEDVDGEQDGRAELELLQLNFETGGSIAMRDTQAARGIEDCWRIRDQEVKPRVLGKYYAVHRGRIVGIFTS
ncbi:hypothetical protein M758_7G002300 [Ceratodon purpureus]|nr:hypothetical protein M758_7G002300 [Ceratodon purpureus]